MVTSMKNYQPKCHCGQRAAITGPGYVRHIRRLGFINAVCGLLIESRFGPGANYDPFVAFSDRFYFCSEPDEMPDEYFDLTWRWPMRSSAEPLIRLAMTRLSIEPDRDLPPTEPPLSPLTLARGSPFLPPGYLG
jgi:hypothetical protein